MKFSVLLVMCVGLATGCQSITSPSGPSSSIRGQVVSDEFFLPETPGLSNPVSGVRVEVVDGPEKGRFSITDSNGRYDLGSLTTEARILATKDGWLPGHWNWVNRFWMVDFISQEPHVMWGTVSLGGTSTRLEGVRIVILDGPNAGKVAQTDATGNYRFSDLLTSPRFNVELSKTSLQTRRVFVDNFNTCEWGTVPCGLRQNLQQNFFMAVSPDR